MQQPHVHTHAHATNIWFHNILAVSFVSELFVARWPLIAPLQLEHLGLLAVADATFAPMTAPLAFQDALVPLPRPLIVPEDLLRRIFTIVRERVPHSFSRGDQGPLFARTELVVHPTIQKNSRCGAGVLVEEFRECKALTFVDGIVPLSFGVSRFSCGASFTSTCMSLDR